MPALRIGGRCMLCCGNGLMQCAIGGSRSDGGGCSLRGVLLPVVDEWLVNCGLMGQRRLRLMRASDPLPPCSLTLVNLASDPPPTISF